MKEVNAKHFITLCKILHQLLQLYDQCVPYAGCMFCVNFVLLFRCG